MRGAAWELNVPRLHPDLHSKIVATLGPATDAPEALDALLSAGVDVVRLNFSHGSRAEHAARLAAVRAWEADHDRFVTVLGDLCGPKIRLNEIAGDEIRFQRGDETRFVRGDAASTPDALTVTYDRFLDEVEAGHRILIDDGMVRFLVTDTEPDALVCTCSAGGVVRPRKGVNLPDSDLTTPALTDADREWVPWALEHELDWLALSFVRRPADLQALHALLPDEHPRPAVLAKIEKPEAVQAIHEIILDADGIMVARGDLGVEMDVWRVPTIQKSIVQQCREFARPVIVATQMLQSMVDSPMPTRAEVSDVANAIFDAADATMLSAETAVGGFAVEVVEMMRRIAHHAEDFTLSNPVATVDRTDTVEDARTAAVTRAAVEVARKVKPRLVAVWTTTGRTVRLVARHRLSIPVIGLAHTNRVARQMNLYYGVRPLLAPPYDNPARMAQAVDHELLARRLVAEGDTIVVVSSTEPEMPGSTNNVLIHTVGTQH